LLSLLVIIAMELTVHDVATLCRVTERTVYRWVKADAIPAYRVMDQYRFNRAEVLAWATRNRIGVPAETLLEEPADTAPLPRVSAALALGGIHYRVAGATKAAVLHAAAQVINVPEDLDRLTLERMLMAREALATTAVGNGIAIPHARNPIVLHVPRTLVALCFLDHGVDFGALDGKPVHSLLVLIARSVREHLHVLARLAFMLHDARFLERLHHQETRDAILRQIEQLEARAERATAHAQARASAKGARGKARNNVEHSPSNVER
jgi:PTS system nitrogen regulatory IIA component